MRRFFGVLGILVLPLAASAQIAEMPVPESSGGRLSVPGGFGSGTNVWLLMQTTPAYTDNKEKPIPGEVASRVYSRYLKSFTYPIPDSFKRQGFTSNSSGGSSSGSSSSSSSGGGSTGY